MVPKYPSLNRVNLKSDDDWREGVSMTTVKDRRRCDAEMETGKLARLQCCMMMIHARKGDGSLSEVS